MKKISFLLSISLFAGSIWAQRSDNQAVEQVVKETTTLPVTEQKVIAANTRLESLSNRAASGDVVALYDLGKAYKNGKITKRDVKKAFECFSAAAEKGYAPAWHEMGVFYKYGMSVPLDYQKAYACFSRSAALHHPEGLYSKSYMEYKGLGCTQDYVSAFSGLSEGAKMGSPSCMYLLGLCYRNGYGTSINKDSATYWLKLSSSLGYRLAERELHTATPEYYPEAEEMVKKVAAIQKMGQRMQYNINQFNKVEAKIMPEEMNGFFKGYLVEYDWSGAKITKVTPVSLDLNWDEGVISGLWSEAERNELLPIDAVWENEKIRFRKVNMQRSTHYHQDDPLVFRFNSAELGMVRQGETLYLAGNLSLTIPDHQEPHQPATLMLERVNSDSPETAEAGLISALNAYPNPFEELVNVEFTIKKSGNTRLQIMSADGKTVFETPGARLEQGSYVYPAKIKTPSGIYIVRVTVDGQSSTTKIIKS